MPIRRNEVWHIVHNEIAQKNKQNIAVLVN